MVAVSDYWLKNKNTGTFTKVNLGSTNDNYSDAIYPTTATNGAHPSNWLTSDYEHESDRKKWYGFEINYENNLTMLPDFGYGLYRVTVEVRSSFAAQGSTTLAQDYPYGVCGHFYLDYRDDNFGTYVDAIGHDQDIFLEFHMPELDYSNPENVTPFYEGTWKFANHSDKNTYPMEPHENGNIYSIWELKGVGNPSTSGFNDFWNNSLVVLTENFNNPRLVWSSYPSSNISSYKIYRASSQTPVIYPFFLTFNLAATVSSSTLDWIDETISINPNGDYIYYRIVGVYSNGNTTPHSNIAGINGYFYKSNKNYEFETNLIQPDYKLMQNHPNPFNPITSIRYSIPKASYVTINVYNSLGIEVANLIDDKKEAGEYSASFDGSRLSSGVYYYRLQTHDYVETKKMVLIK